MAISETWKFNENIGKTWRFEGVYHGEDTSHLKRKGVIYVLIKDIKEVGTGDVFRDHTHIEVSPTIYERYFKHSPKKQKLEFTARTYHYNKGFTTREQYVRTAVGLEDMNEIKFKNDELHRNKDKKGIKIKTVGWLLRHIDNEGYEVKENHYEKLWKKNEVKRLTGDIVNVLLEYRGNEKEYNIHEFDSEESSYKAVLTKMYPDYRTLKNKDKKYPNYKGVRIRGVGDAYKSNIELRRGHMVLTIIHKATGNIADVYKVNKNNKKEYVEVLERVMRYFGVELDEYWLQGISFNRINKFHNKL